MTLVDQLPASTVPLRRTFGPTLSTHSATLQQLMYCWLLLRPTPVSLSFMELSPHMAKELPTSLSTKSEIFLSLLWCAIFTPLQVHLSFYVYLNSVSCILFVLDIYQHFYMPSQDAIRTRTVSSTKRFETAVNDLASAVMKPVESWSPEDNPVRYHACPL